MRLACEQLVQNTLAPMMQEVEEAQKQESAEGMWKAVLKEASNAMTFPNRQLTAYALFDGSRRDKPPGQTNPTTSVAFAGMHAHQSC